MTLQSFDDLAALIRQTMASLPDDRASNTQFTMEDIGLAAFSVFHTQSPSFLASQRDMRQKKGQSNAQTVFKIDKLATANHIRDTLDDVQPTELLPIYDAIFESLRERDVLAQFQGFAGTTGVALDGTWYHNSEKIHCFHTSSCTIAISTTVSSATIWSCGAHSSSTSGHLPVTSGSRPGRP